MESQPVFSPVADSQFGLTARPGSQPKNPDRTERRFFTRVELFAACGSTGFYEPGMCGAGIATNGHWIARTRARLAQLGRNGEGLWLKAGACQRVPLVELGWIVESDIDGSPQMRMVYQDADGHLSVIDGRYSAMLAGLSVVRLADCFEVKEEISGDRENFDPIAGVDGSGRIAVTIMPMAHLALAGLS